MKVISKKDRRNGGFTLIEVVATLIVVAIVAGIGTLFIENVVKGYGFARSHGQLAQKAQATLLRLTDDFRRIRAVDASSGANQITYSADFSTAAATVFETHTVAISPDDSTLLMYDSDVLVDQLNSFALKYFAADGQTEVSPTTARLIQVTIVFAGAGGTTCQFSTRVALP
jgi:prepilin-type N-terminal cleavage/methylation domain-containing protein